MDIMSIDSLIINLVEDYPTENEKINEIKVIFGELKEEKNIKENIERLQQICNELYNISSTENLIELQVIINSYRYKYDITDPREILNWDNGKGYVQ